MVLKGGLKIMKKIFRKAITVLGSAALIGMTVGAAAAASYPAPFTSNTAIVVGSGVGVSGSDMIAASDIVTYLNANAAGSSVTTTSGGKVTGESADLASGSDLLYLNDEFSENVQTFTKADFPTVLADSTFTDDDGTSYDFEQTLTIGTSTNNKFVFGNSDNDLDDPALMVALSTSTAAPIYDLTATFNTAVPFNATESEGEEITLFGKTYTVGTATDADTLVLLGGAGSAIINVGEESEIIVDGEKYKVSLTGLSSASTTQASITVAGDTKTFTQGQTKTVGGVDVYVKTVFRTGDSGDGYAEVQLGADKLTLESGSAVQIGADTDDIEGTLVTITGGVNAMTELKFSIAVEDNDVNHLLVGDSFVDPIFGSVIVNFAGVENGPEFSGEKDTGRTDLDITKGGNRELMLALTDNAGNSATIPFAYQGSLADDSGNTLSVVEGASIADDGYFILNSGNNQHFMQITKLNLDDGANSDVAMKDLISGQTYTFDNHNFGSGYSATIAAQTYTITNDSATTVTITSSDYSATNKYVFPYLELVSGEDTRVALTDNIIAINEYNTTLAPSITLELPTGSVVVATVAADTISVTDSAGAGTTISTLTLAANDTIKVGTVYYNFAVVDGTGANCTDINISIASSDVETAVTASSSYPGIIFVEDDDKSEATTTTKNSVVVDTTDDGSYSTVSTPRFPGQTEDTGYNSEGWDDTDLTGWLTNYGTYVWRDTGDTNQAFVGLSYGKGMMSADVVFAEGEASTSTTTTNSTDAGVKIYKDNEASSFAGKNLIVVGGSAINAIAAELLEGAYSEAAFTSATGIAAGEFLINSYDRAGKTALLVAGYNGADTEKAVEYLLNLKVDTTVGKKLKGTSATEATVVTD